LTFCRRLGGRGAVRGRIGAIYPSEPLPFSDFYSARARALASCGRGQSNTTAFAAELEHLREEGERLGLQVALPEIVKAIEEMRG
jgi:hypothetical protein